MFHYIIVLPAKANNIPHIPRDLPLVFDIPRDPPPVFDIPRDPPLVFDNPTWQVARLGVSMTYNRASLNLLMKDEKISTMVLNRCSARSLLILLRTNRSINAIVTAYIKKAYDVNIILRRYFTDPLSFRLLQAYTGTIISGSTALQFFDRDFYPESDLDVYAPKAWGKEVGHFLLRAGYVFVPSQSQHHTFDGEMQERRVVDATATYGNFRGIAGVFNFMKIAPGGTMLKVQLMVAVRSPMDVILRYHSSMSPLFPFVNIPLQDAYSCGDERHYFRESLLPIPSCYARRTFLPRLYLPTGCRD